MMNWIEQAFELQFRENQLSDCLTELSILRKELERYKKAKEDGRLLILPCKVGDTVWRVIRHCTESEFDDCVGCERNESGRCQPKFFEQAFSVGLYDQIGKTVFLTREESEAKLKELKE